MKRNFIPMMLAIAVLTSMNNIIADCCNENRIDRVFSDCYACGTTPLNCGSFSAQFHAGVAPIVWKQRGSINLISCATSATPFINLATNLPKFSNLFKTPWIVGGILGHALYDNTELILEFNYLQAKSKSCALSFVIPNTAADQSVILVVDKYRLFEAYVGARYYWDRWCNRVSPFIGGKIGFTHHYKIHSLVEVNSGCQAFNSCTFTDIAIDDALFSGNTVFSGGAHVGLDICFGCNWSVVFTAELVASCGPRIVRNNLFSTALLAPTLATNLLAGYIGNELRFPITAALKYNF